MQHLNLISISDAAKVLGIKPQTARDWLWKNKFPVKTVKINGKRLVPSHLLVEYLNDLISLELPKSSTNSNPIHNSPQTIT